MEHNDYWAKRFEQLLAAEMKKAEELSAEMVRMYRQAAQDINDDIARWYARFAAENKMSLAEAGRVLDGRELAELRWTLKDYIKYGEKNALSGAYIQRLKNASARVHIDRLEALKYQVAQHVEKLAAKGNARLTEVLRDIYPDSRLRSAYEVQRKRKFEPFASVPETDIERILKRPWVSDGLNFSDRIWRDKERLLNVLQGELTVGLIRGEGYEKMAKRIAGKMGVSIGAAARLVETEAAFFASKGQMDAFRDLGVEQYEFVATLDSRTSERCREMDKKVLPLSEFKPGITAPPLHCRCRSTTCPYFDDEFTRRETRAARDPATGKTVQVDGKLNYAEWKDIFVDKKLTLEDWKKKNVVSQATNAAVALSATVQNGTINTNQIQPFSPAKTIRDAEDYARSVLGIQHVSYKGCDIDTANDWNKGLHESFSRFPELKKNFGFVGEAHERNSMLKPVVRQHYVDDCKKRMPWLSPSQIDRYADAMTRRTMRKLQIAKNTFAISSSGNSAPFSDFRGVVVNRDYGKNAGKFIQALLADVGSKFHPIGCGSIRSVLDHEIGHQLDNLLGIRNIQTIKDLFDSRTHAEISDALSRYAWDHRNPNRYAEMIAEAWAEYCNNPTPREIAETVGKTIEAEYQKRFGKGGGMP